MPSFCRLLACTISLTLLGVFMNTEAQAHYSSLDWQALEAGQAESALVTLRGAYISSQEYTQLIRGTIRNDGVELSVTGEVFDWQPQSESYVELWGQLTKGQSGYSLTFHNGRDLLDDSRHAQGAFDLKLGQRQNLVLKLELVGTARAPQVVGLSENLVSFELPDSYDGPFGIVCLEALVSSQRTQQEKGIYALEDPKFIDSCKG